MKKLDPLRIWRKTLKMRAWILLLVLAPACVTARAQGGSGSTAGAAAQVEPGVPASPESRPTSEPPLAATPQPRPPETPLEGAAARAEALAGKADLAGALSAWSDYVLAEGVRDHERAFARLRADELAARLSPDAAVELWRGADTRLARAAAGPRAAAALRSRGYADGGRRIDDEAASLRQSLGWERAATWVGPGDPRRLGLAIPLSGQTAVIGESLLRGAMMALGDARGEDGAAFELVLRDSAPERGAQAAVTQALAREEAVIAVVGLGEPAAAAQAGQHGVPLLALTEQAPGASSTAFQVLHASETRAVALARRALAFGARSFAILGPDNAAGKRLADAFAGAVGAAGGKVTARVTYMAGANSFTAPVGQLKRAAFDAVFVPEDADRLALIAPALAFADLMPMPAQALSSASARPARGRAILLLSTARGLSSKLLKGSGRDAGRYVQGALLAPGFFPDEGDPKGGAFVERFRSLYGQDPQAVDAYGYDAVRMILQLVERGAKNRGDVLRALQAERHEGVTGAFQFGPDHARIDLPAVYVVEGDEIKALR